MATRSCIVCGEPLIPDPVRRHWAHCPKCNPEWAQFAYGLHKDSHDREFARRAARDKRGRPTIGGEPS